MTSQAAPPVHGCGEALGLAVAVGDDVGLAVSVGEEVGLEVCVGDEVELERATTNPVAGLAEPALANATEPTTTAAAQARPANASLLR